jgi:hypothetical protein
MQGDKVVRRGQRPADGRFRLVDDEPVYGAILEGTLAVEAALLAPVDGLPDRADFPFAHHNKVRQAFLNGPFRGRRTPVEASLVELRGQLAGLLLNLLKLLAIEFEFRDGHSRDYSEATALSPRCATSGRLTERHEALTQTVESIAAAQLRADERTVVLEERTTQLMETMDRLANIVISPQ